MATPGIPSSHELGHATQHLDKLMLGASMPRRRIGNVTPDWIPKFRSAEHQAMVFGAAFLINDAIARRLSSADEISVHFGISLEAARIYFEQVQEEIARPSSSLRVQKIAEEVKAAIAPKASSSSKISFLNDPCSACGQQKVFPVGHKFMCQACDAVYDRFQDGDQVQ
jgi:Zn-dependent peptidase ImmA (M78 family)